MSFNETLNQLKETAKSKLVKADATPEEIEEANNFSKSLDDLNTEYEKVLSENNKFRDTIVKMVQESSGKGEAGEESGGGKTPRTMEQIISDMASKSKDN